MVNGLFNLPDDRQGVDDGVDAEVCFAPVTPGGDVVGSHRGREHTTERMDSPFYRFAFAARAEGLHHRVVSSLCRPTRWRAGGPVPPKPPWRRRRTLLRSAIEMPRL